MTGRALLQAGAIPRSEVIQADWGHPTTALSEGLVFVEVKKPDGEWYAVFYDPNESFEIEGKVWKDETGCLFAHVRFPDRDSKNVSLGTAPVA